ncbi:MAG: amidophosphoribosyltransferase [Clostridiales bacterium]|nr:amidophosphoribosyltransferase [Clostridiales bacterium]
MGDNLDVARLTYYGLYALQHRGQESCGIAVNSVDENGKIQILQYKDMGLVQEVFNSLVLNELKGHAAVGHVRYTTAGSSSRENAQPLVSKYQKGTFALAHNGNLVDVDRIRKELEDQGAIFQTNNDSEIIAHLMAKERIKTNSTAEAILKLMGEISGAYSLIILTPKRMVVARDPQGFRPLCIGKLKNSYVFASETCALDSVGAEFMREVEPGEVIVVDENGLSSFKERCGQPTSLCIFEYIYFARPDSIIDGASVHAARLNAGKYLAQESPVDADVVIGVPDSGLDAALGYSRESKIPYGVGFIKNRYIGRTFIQPTQEEREAALRIKLNAMREAVEGKRVIMIDDSIVRGTTSGRIVKLLRDAGATEVHVRISSPPFLNPCYFGTDISDRDSLIACKMSVEETCKHIGADSLAYLSLNALGKIAEGSNCGKCDACFTGKYPVYVPQEDNR